MNNFAADFTINNDEPLEVEYTLEPSETFDCSFEIYAGGVVWGNITGDINNQTDLINLLNTKVDLTSFEELSQTVTNNYNELTGDISDLATTVTDNYNTLSGQISDLTTTVNDNYTSLDNRLTTAEGSILDLTDTVNDNYTELNGKITTTNNNLSSLSQTVENNNTAINDRVDGIVDSFDGDISDLNNAIDNLSDTVSDNYTNLDGKITDNTDNITTIQNTINSYGDIVSYDAAYFATANQGALADTALQPNDNISELVNDVGYITSASLPTVNNATITIQKNGADVGTFTLNQANNDTLNITVPTQASDIGAMPDTTTIEDLTTTAQLNALNSGATTSNIGQITTNQNNIADIRSLIPLQASTSNQLADKGFVNSSIATNTANFIGTFNSVAELEAYSGTLTNNDYAFVATTDSAGNTLYDRYKYNADTQEWLFEYELNNSSFTAQQWASINSGITSGDVTLIGTALQPNDNISELTNDAGYITSASLPTNYVTTDTVQNISGRKTFLGEKAIYFKQNTTSDKLGFTLYNPSNTEVGGLEYRPNTISGKALLAINCSQLSGNFVGFRYWASGAINIIAPKPSTPGDYYIPVSITDGTNTVTADNNGTLNISSLLPNVSDMATQTWVTNQGYTTNVGTVTSVNNTQPDASGNVTLIIPDTATWGNITGTLSDQTDLQDALNKKQDKLTAGENITIEEQQEGWTPAVQDSNLGENVWTPLAYDGTKFVAIGYGGYVSTSTDGTTWTPAVQDSNLGENDWVSVAYGNNKFVAIGEGGYVSTSTDGTTWTSAVQDSNLGENNWSGVAYDGTKFVAIGYGGYVSTSTDGTTWTPAVQDSNLGENNWVSVAYGNNKFVAIDVGGYVSASTDGTTWTSAVQDSNLGENNWSGVAYDGTKFVAIGYGGYVSTSTDGTTWTPAVQDSNLGENDWVGVAYGNNKFVAIGEGGYISQYFAGGTIISATVPSLAWGSITGTLSNQTDLQNALDAKQNTISDLSTIRSGASLGATALQPNDNISELTNDVGYITSASLPTVNNGTLDIQVNGTSVGTFTANDTNNVTANISVPTSISDLTDDTSTYPIDKADTLTGLTASVSELNYVDGVTSNIQTQIDNKADTTLSNVSSIDSNSAVQTALDGKANTSLSNLTSTSSTNFDGQWTPVSNTQVAVTVSVNGSTNLSYTLTDVPNDGYKYEVLLSGQAWTTTTSGSSCGLRISSSLISTIELCGCVTRTSSQVGARGSAIIPIDTDRKIIVHRDTAWTGSINLWLRGYRRIGTNS